MRPDSRVSDQSDEGIVDTFALIRATPIPKSDWRTRVGRASFVATCATNGASLEERVSQQFNAVFLTPAIASRWGQGSSGAMLLSPRHYQQDIYLNSTSVRSIVTITGSGTAVPSSR